jgi:hypothetical protein
MSLFKERDVSRLRRKDAKEAWRSESEGATSVQDVVEQKRVK